MSKKESLYDLIERLDGSQLAALKVIVESMVYQVEEISFEDKTDLDKAIEEYKNGKVVRGKEVDEYFA